MIRKEKDKFVLYTKDGDKKLGTFDTKEEAEDREREINFFKHQKSSVMLAIVKATLQDDGSMRWQAVTSDTSPDKADEQTSIALFQDWIERAEKREAMSFLPPPRMPFLGLSHYPALDGYGEAGIADKMYIDGDRFKASGVFYPDTDHPLGKALFKAIREEKSLIQKGETIEKPIRISAGWWDLQHAHGNMVFTRKSLGDKCPMCESGFESKTYLKGQLDHFAATRVPMNPRTSIGLEEKSMATRKDDAATIIDPEMAEELEKRSRAVVGKSEAELPEGMVVKATTFGDFIKSKREEMELSVPDIEGDMPITEGTIRSIENGEIETPSTPVIEAFAKVLKVSKKELLSKLPKGAKPADKVAKSESEAESGTVAVAVIGNNMVELSDDGQAGGIQLSDEGDTTTGVANDTPLAEAVKGDFAEVEAHLPFGGATSLTDAEAFMDAQDKKMEAVSNWHLLQDVMGNIRRRGEMDAEFNQAAAMATAINETGQRIAALKSSIEDAYLLYPATTADDQPAEIDTPYIYRGEIMSDNTQTQGAQASHPADVMKTKVDEILTQPTGREEKAAAIQAELEGYAQTVKAQLDQVAPPDQTAVMTDALKGAIAEAFAPLSEKIGLLSAKMDQQPGQPAQPQQAMALPVQKSAVPGPNAVPVGDSSGLPVSPSTGQPSALTAHIRKSVGLAQ